MRMCNMEKRPISDVLRGMEVGAEELFPIEQLNSINAAKNSTLVIDRAKGMNWSVKRDLEHGCVKVTRTK